MGGTEKDRSFRMCVGLVTGSTLNWNQKTFEIEPAKNGKYLKSNKSRK